jgi:glycosyltransferase involved in cell wall biosynthesis
LKRCSDQNSSHIFSSKLGLDNLLDGSVVPRSTQPTLAVGPVMPGWGSWDWVGTFLVEHLQGPFRTSTFEPWQTPSANVVVVVKHAPPASWLDEMSRRSAIVYCPIDWYGEAAEIDADTQWLRKCARIVVHCHRLKPYFERLAETSYIDHPVKFIAPTRKTFRSEGSLVWIGVRTNLPPLVNWVNANALPAALDVLTNPEQAGKIPSPTELGFRTDREVRIHEWTPERHLQFTASARAALDIKGEDFRSRHKPPAKAIDFIASGLPLAMNPGSSSAEHLADLGLKLPSPLDTDRWLSESYWKETRRLGERLARELAPERTASRFRKIIETALASRPVFKATAPPPNPRSVATTSQPATKATATSANPRSTFKLYGLLITKDDQAVFADWCRDQLPLYDAVVCLDGSEGNDTACIASGFTDRLVYLHERDFSIPHKTDHGLRAVVHREIVRRFGRGHWIMCCHTDEFCYHDPRKIAGEAEHNSFDCVSWFSPHFYPHSNEWSDWTRLRHLPVPERHRYYHWSYRGDGFPWCEDRLYRDTVGVEWDGKTHGNVRPLGLTRPASFHPILRHYKVLVTDPAFYDVSASAAHYRTHWVGTPARTGVPFPVRETKDLFVSTVPNYQKCDEFEGTFTQPWNMGEQFRPEPPSLPPDDPRTLYHKAQDFATRGEHNQARAILTSLDTDKAPPSLRALVKNDLAALAVLTGDRTAALSGFRAALELDPTCGVARANLVALEGEQPVSAIAPSLPQPTSAEDAVRVAVVSMLFNWPSTGGGNVHTAELTKFLSEAGYTVRHFYAKFEPWGIGNVTERTPHPAHAVAFSQTEWTLPNIIGRFRAAIDEFDPDWVVLTDSWNLKPLLAEAAGGRPYILRLQALECLCPLNNVRLLPGPDRKPRQCNRHQLATPDECAKCVRDLEHTSGDLHRAERALAGVGTPEYRDALFKAFSGAAAVLAVNPLTAAMVEPFTRDVRVVTAGMDPARFPYPFPSEKMPPRSAGRLRILFAGLTHEWMKGFHILRETCDKLWSVRQDFEVVATDNSPEDHPEPWARYVGWQSQQSLPAFMASADIVVVPTVAQEALGRTAVEAMAAGKPVVASRLGGLPFTIPDGATGLLCAPSDPVDLAAKLSMLLDDASLRERLGIAGRKRFEEHYAWPAIIERHYRPLFGNPVRTRPTSGKVDRTEVTPVTRADSPVLVVVSHYPGRSLESLVRLLDSMATLPAGIRYALRVVVNRDGTETLNLPERHRGVEVLYRTNSGYNIGAWEAGWRSGAAHDAYLFVQDECRIVRSDWLAAFVRVAETPRVGLVGECFSPDWDAPWELLRERYRGHELKEHTINGQPAERVDCYLDFFRKKGITPGPKGDHLQSLILFATRAVLERIGGFPESHGYGEAIAAEIGISKKVQAAGLTLAQVEPEAFTYIEHPQWLHRRARSVPHELVRPQSG